jgi:hypothetical protein
MPMTPNDDLHHVEDLLRELRQQHRSTEAPPAIETLLRAAAEQRSASAIPAWRRPSLAWGLMTATLILAIVGAFEWSTHRAPQRGSTGTPLQALHHPASPAPSAPSHAKPDAPLRVASVSPARPSHKSKPAVNTNSSSEWQSEFVALPASEGLPPATAVSLVRMRIQQSSLQQYGLEVPAESSAQTLLAEFMVGEDGLPRAVRILQ